MAQWFIGTNPKLWSPAQLKALAAQGKINPQTMVRREDSTTAIPAGRLQGLFPDPEPVSFSEDGAIPAPLADESASNAPSDACRPFPGVEPRSMASRGHDGWLDLEQAGIAGYFKALIHPQIYAHLPMAMITAVVIVCVLAGAAFLLSGSLFSVIASVGLPVTMLIMAAVMALVMGIVVLRVPLALTYAVVERERQADPSQWPLAQVAIMGAIILAITWLVPATLLGFLHPIAGTLAALFGLCVLPLFLLSVARAEGDWSGLNPSGLFPVLSKRWATFLGFTGVSVLFAILSALVLVLIAYVVVRFFADPQTQQVEGLIGLSVVIAIVLGVFAWLMIIINYMATAVGIWWRQGLNAMAAELDASEQGQRYLPAQGEGLFAGLGVVMILVMVVLAATEVVSISGITFTDGQSSTRNSPQVTGLVKGNPNDTREAWAINRPQIDPQQRSYLFEIPDQNYAFLRFVFNSHALCQIDITSPDSQPVDVYVFNAAYYQRWMEEFSTAALDLSRYDILEKHEGVTQVRIDRLAAGQEPIFVVIDNSGASGVCVIHARIDAGIKSSPPRWK